MVFAAFRARALRPCTVRALYVHCACTVKTHTTHTHTRAQLRLETYRTLQKPGMAEEENRWRLRKTHVSVYVYELAVSHRGCEESRKDFYIEISYNKYVGSYIHTNIRTYIRTYSQTCEHAASAQLGQKTRRQDFCRRLMEKILHHQTHLESWPSCSPFNIGFKKMSPKQRSWMTEILHRRAMLQNTTLKRGCGGGFQYFYVHLHLGKWSSFTNIFQMSRNHHLEKHWENHLWNDHGFFLGGASMV